MFSWTSFVLASFAWKNIGDASCAGLVARPMRGGLPRGYDCIRPPPAIILCGLLGAPTPFIVPVLKVGCDEVPALRTLSSTQSPPADTNFGFVVGVEALLTLGVDCALSTRDFREDDRGVTFALTKALTGVARSSFETAGDLIEATSLRIDRLEPGVAVAFALPCWAANLGVRGDFTVRFEASVGINGLAPLLEVMLEALFALDLGESYGIFEMVAIASDGRHGPVDLCLACS